MRIAVLADTHDRYPPDLPARLREADEIWHLGDVCAPETLVELEQLGPPLRIVAGNGDDHPGWPETLRLERGGFTFLLIHIPPSRTPPGVNAVLHGHTHVPRDETDQLGVRWLNPGCITRPRGAGTSFAWLLLEPGQDIEWRIVKL
jgi:putative phosphoesterase